MTPLLTHNLAHIPAWPRTIQLVRQWLRLALSPRVSESSSTQDPRIVLPLTPHCHSEITRTRRSVGMEPLPAMHGDSAVPRLHVCVCVFGEVVYNVVPSWIHSGLESRAKFQNMIGSRRSLQLSRCSASYSTSVCAQSCIYRSGQRCLCSTATSSRPIIVGRMNMDGSWTNHTNKRVAGTPRFAIRPFLKQIVNNGYDKIFCFVFPFWNL